MKRIFLLIASLFLSVNAFADCLPFCPFYIDGFAGANFENNFKRDDANLHMNAGYIVGGNVGYRITNFLSIEGEAAFRNNLVRKLNIDDMKVDASGKNNKVTAMANAIVNIPIFENMFVPYVGAGVGKRWDNVSLDLNSIETPDGVIIFDRVRWSNNGFAYQGIAGITFFSATNFSAAVEYRYLDGKDFTANHSVDVNLKVCF